MYFWAKSYFEVLTGDRRPETGGRRPKAQPSLRGVLVRNEQV